MNFLSRWLEQDNRRNKALWKRQRREADIKVLRKRWEVMVFKGEWTSMEADAACLAWWERFSAEPENPPEWLK